MKKIIVLILLLMVSQVAYAEKISAFVVVYNGYESQKASTAIIESHIKTAVRNLGDVSVISDPTVADVILWVTPLNIKDEGVIYSFGGFSPATMDFYVNIFVKPEQESVNTSCESIVALLDSMVINTRRGLLSDL